ncbi:NAD(P)-dependent oxidoreductase [Amycolatopsis pittospori]|uniref:NAD(P)-dependent oxidoreductase n=1 Tax=Amycolatopsis pittospori TaxID=2749434 RepID=UPI0015F03547|nr:NAD(P)H-binding protein [Amycolatopsis pittospori]
MAKLVVFGGTGYAGGKITAEARSRGHEVVVVSRNAEGEGSRAGSLYDEAFLAEVAKGADVLVIAVHGQGGLLDAVPSIAQVAKDNGARIGVVGGAGSLHVAEGGPRLIDTPEFPDEYKGEAGSHAKVLEAFRELPEDIDWFYVSPAAEFGAWAEGERTGQYRLGGDVLLTDENGASKVGGADYAIAFVDEIDKPAHRRQRFCVAY